ncbi:MAG: DUF2891 domain-containing protein [Acidobacteria bacterium]|nr:DUF2891 domain-containing protein [Acidobacteriota bacterium]
MFRWLLVPLFLPVVAAQPAFDQTQAERFARLALDCVHKEYPNKIAHALNSAADVLPPSTLTPAFYGCYDWHSSVHGHWLLARLVRLFPTAPFAPEAREALSRSLTPANLAAEAAYLSAPGRNTFERPYGLAWLLQLSTELRGWDDPDARRWSAALLPLEQAAVARLSAWLPKLQFPIRTGEHNNTAFSLGLILDYARAARNQPFEQLLLSRARDYYLKDRACPLHYEPSGEDFLSPCLAQADLLRRVLPRKEFGPWLSAFLPAIQLKPTVVSDVTDGKLYHLAGLNLSRAWMLDGILSALPAADLRRAGLSAQSRELRAAGLAAVTAAHYEGGHWLGSFAVYLVSNRGILP